MPVAAIARRSALRKPPTKGDRIKAKIGKAATSRRNNPNNPTSSVARKLWLAAELMLDGRVSLAMYEARQGQGFRTFQRDLQQLRQVLGGMGFTISPVKEHAYVELSRVGKTPTKKIVPADNVSRLIGAIALALGEPIREALRVPSEAPSDPFFTFAMPRLLDKERIARLTQSFHSAVTSAGGRAVVEFQYRSSNSSQTAGRRVEPYRIVFRNGGFYLLGYDLRREGWRYFSLHRIEGNPRRAGTASTDRPVPEEYGVPDAVGFIKSKDAPQRITVWLSDRIAPSLVHMRWQAKQELLRMPDGSWEMTFTVRDEAEIIRWAFSFGTDARVIAPQHAVDAAAELAGQLAWTYSQAREPRVPRR